MDWLKALVPMLGTALGGPLGGAAAAFIADKLGINDKTVEAVTEVLNSSKLSPDQLSSLKLAELEFKKFLEQNKIDLAKLDVENTVDARAMQIAVKSNTPDILAGIVVTGFFTILILLMLGLLTVSDQQSLLILLGSLAAGFGAVLNFFFGSSHSSQTKDILIANSSPTVRK